MVFVPIHLSHPCIGESENLLQTFISGSLSCYNNIKVYMTDYFHRFFDKLNKS